MLCVDWWRQDRTWIIGPRLSKSHAGISSMQKSKSGRKKRDHAVTRGVCSEKRGKTSFRKNENIKMDSMKFIL